METRVSLPHNARMAAQPTDRQTGHEFDAVVRAPFGAIGIRCSGAYVSEISYLPPALCPRHPSAAVADVALEAARQLVAYLSDPDFTFDLPLLVRGTDFQQRVWRGISAIRRGATRRYGELAQDLGSAPRAIGQACGANPLPIVIPCHRVVAAAGGLNGGLGGFAHSRDGFLVDVKRWLLRHEGVLTER
jgi:methylated-DNA-[protein]-cysteine S-methyltransferase